MDNLDIERMTKFNPSGETIVFLAICLVLIILFIILGIKAKKADPLKKPKGLLLVGEMCVEKLDNFVTEFSIFCCIFGHKEF